MSVNYKTKQKPRSNKNARPDGSPASASALKEPSAAYFVRNTEIPEFFGQQINKGERLPVDSSVENNSPRLFYSHQHGEIWLGDSIEWMRGLESGSADLVFADPPYNIKKAEWDTFESQQEYVAWSVRWIEQAARVLKPEGTLYVCGFSEILADLRLPASRFFKGCRWIVWHYKNKANLGDPRPDMLTNERLREQIRDFQSFLVRDLWSLAKE
jgi:site-specific DNA-methyltransferase (adenine-specific)